MTAINPLASTTKAPVLPQPPTPAGDDGGGSHFSFHDFLSIINPLQHIPVIGTLYRAITGDTIGAPEKIAGDTLYGGLWGAISSLADTAFQAVTGKDIGDTVLAMFTGHHDTKPAVVAARNDAPPSQPDAGLSALNASLIQKGVDGELAQRALAAYRKSMALPSMMIADAQ
jgi:hypothetical protein